MRETLLLFIVLTEYCSSSCLFCPVLSSLTLFTNKCDNLCANRLNVAQWLERRTGDRGVLGSNPADSTSLRNFDNSVYSTLPVSF